MKSKHFARVIFLILGSALIATFQNCRNAQFSPSSLNEFSKSTAYNDQQINATGETAPQMLIENQNREVITIQVGSQDKKDDINEVEAVDINLACIDQAKYHNSTIDISQQQNLSKISAMHGKNFIYSSTGNNQVNEVDINIEESNGRLIICGLNVNKISLKNGRLDLIRSHVGSITENKGTIKGDGISTVGGQIVVEKNNNTKSNNGKK